MSTRRRILFFSHCLPYPPHAGGTSRPFNIARQLQKEFDVHLTAFYRGNHHNTAKSAKEACANLSRYVKGVHGAVPIAAEHSSFRRLLDHSRSLVSRKSYTFYQHRSPELLSTLRKVMSEFQPDLVHLTSIDLYGWYREFEGIPVTCTHQDIESDLLRQRAGNYSLPPFRWYVRKQASLVEHVEREMCPLFDLNIVMSEADANRLRRVVAEVSTIVVPNGVDTEYFRPRGEPTVDDDIVFIGPTYSFANRDAVDFFLCDIWPRIRSAKPKTALKLIGSGPNSVLARFSKYPGVTCLGYVQDIRPHLAQAACSIVPIRFGGGTRLKILDSWAAGTPVVSTSVGCEGLLAVEEENILVRDDPVGFADAVLALLDSFELRSRLAEGGRCTVEETYSWDVVGEHLRAGYRSLL